MSSLIFTTDETQAFVATDTLAAFDGRPAFFTTKAFPLPHLRMVIAGTGLAGFLDHWLVSINTSPVRDIDDLNSHAPAGLALVWGIFKKQFPGMTTETTTVYHFGFSENTGKMRSFAYPSEQSFAPKLLDYGPGVKPLCVVRDGWEFPADIPELMNQQRSIQAKLPTQERVYIGGEIQIIHLTVAGFHLYRSAQFDDFEEQETAIYKSLR